MGNFMDNEDCFGFHSEYYIDPNWRLEEWGLHEDLVTRGYTRYSKYQQDIYYLPKSSSDVTFILKSNIERKTSCAIILNTKQKFNYSYIAVHRPGIFIYDEGKVTLFGFDGNEIHTHKFGKMGKNDPKRCIYIYDNKVIYSEKKVGIHTSIYCVDMLKKQQRLLWETQKGDTEFDSHFQKYYRQRWGRELAYSKNVSNIGNVDCRFLYANKQHIIAGYTRTQGNSKNTISYIIDIDLVANTWEFLDCYATIPKAGHPLPKDAGRIFSFNMLDGTMWTKVNGEDIRLIHTDIQNISSLQGSYLVEWKLPELKGTGNLCYYFDGNYGYMAEYMSFFKIQKNGEEEKLYFHEYQTERFWCFGEIYIIPNFFGSHSFRNVEDGYIFSRSDDEGVRLSVGKREEEELVQKAKNSLKAKEAKKHSCNPTKLFAADWNSWESISRNNSQMTLAEFRHKAPNMVGFREELLAYRKSLSNSWDYNAYVGILLGVGGPKHGDAACQNFAIGQGDNGNNTKKTLEARGLMSVFEKYKGKKIDASVKLADVEQEICWLVPKYETIRQKLKKDVFCKITM